MIDFIKRKYIKWKYTIISLDNYVNLINRKASIENELMQCYKGNAPLPDEKKCFEWAIRLGASQKYWPDWVKEEMKR